MARLTRQPRNTPPQAESSWVFEGDEDHDYASDEDPVNEAEDVALRTSTTNHITSSQNLPPVPSQALSPQPIQSPIFPSSLNGRSMASSRSGSTVLRKSRRMNRSTASIAPQEPQFVMPTVNVQDTFTSSGPRISSTTQSPSSKRKDDRHSQDDSPPPRKRQSTRSSAVNPTNTKSALSSLALLWNGVLVPALQMVLSVLSIIFWIIKPIMAIVLAFSILAYLGRFLFNRALSNTIAPLCSIPGASLLNLPFCSIYSAANPVEFDELMTVQSAFEDVLSSSSGGATLPLDMKRSESSIRDLKHVVEYSALPSRGELVFELSGFIDTARQAAADLTRFNSRIGRAIDHVLSTNRWTLQVIDGLAAREEARGAVGAFLQNTVLAPFHTPKVTEQLLLEQYIKHTRAIEDQIADLILEAQALLGILQNLDDRLDVIHGITTRDGVALKGSRDEMFAQLWTWVGGNRSELKKNKEHMSLLKQLIVYRKTAWDHVSGTMLKLQTIAAGLEDLRERVAAPDVLGVRSDIPLRLHIDRIQMGVDRLEIQRNENRQVESQARRTVLDRGEGIGRMLVEG